MARNTHHMKHITGRLFSVSPMALVAFFAPIKMMGWGILFLIIMDLATGIWASVKTNVPISSAKLSRSVVKSIVYFLAMIVGHVAESWVIPDVPITKAVAFVIGSTELLSIFENFTRISGVDFKNRLMGLLKPEQKDEENK